MSNTTPISLQELDRQHLWHPYASIALPPPVNQAVAAQGTRITLADGTQLIDAVSSWWCVAHGHNHPEIVEAIQRQSQQLCHLMFAGFTHQPAQELAQELLKLLPPGLNRFFYADSGSIAVECAAKMAVQYHYAAGNPRRCRIIALKGGYHGDTTGAMALSDPDGMHVLFKGLMAQHLFAEQPRSPYGGAWQAEDILSLKTLLEEHGHEVAAVILEPIFQGGNAMWLYHPQYLVEARRLCDEYGVLLILDEIATGFGRTGKLFACHHAGITPDIMTLGKILTGGAITMAVCVASEKVAQVISSRGSGAFMHGPTYMANPLACAAAAASMRLVQSGYWVEKVRRIQESLLQLLSPARELPNVKDLRVLGAIGVLELEYTPDPGQVMQVVRECGVWLRPFGSWLYTMPPFITTDDELEVIAKAMIRLAELGWEHRHDAPPAAPQDPILGIHE